MLDGRISRRAAVHLGALPLLGIDLPTVLAGNAARAGGKGAKAKACIFIFLWGGPAQQDTLDPKPDAPVEYRGEFSTIQTALPGIRVCEHLPGIARRLDQVCMIRSMTHTDVNHTTAPHLLLTGHPLVNQGQPLRDDFPGMSSVLARLGRGGPGGTTPRNQPDAPFARQGTPLCGGDARPGFRLAGPGMAADAY